MVKKFTAKKITKYFDLISTTTRNNKTVADRKTIKTTILQQFYLPLIPAFLPLQHSYKILQQRNSLSINSTTVATPKSQVLSLYIHIYVCDAYIRTTRLYSIVLYMRKGCCIYCC
jgi:hypothetical protein